MSLHLARSWSGSMVEGLVLAQLQCLMAPPWLHTRIWLWFWSSIVWDFWVFSGKRTDYAVRISILWHFSFVSHVVLQIIIVSSIQHWRWAHVRELWSAGPGPSSEVGPGAHSQLWRKPRFSYYIWGVGWWSERIPPGKDPSADKTLNCTVMSRLLR